MKKLFQRIKCFLKLCDMEEHNFFKSTEATRAYQSAGLAGIKKLLDAPPPYFECPFCKRRVE